MEESEKWEWELNGFGREKCEEEAEWNQRDWIIVSELNRKIESESEMPFGLVHAGEISDPIESYTVFALWQASALVINTHNQFIDEGEEINSDILNCKGGYIISQQIKVDQEIETYSMYVYIFYTFVSFL